MFKGGIDIVLYEGKAKQIYTTDNDNEFVVYYKDDATAFNGEKKAEIASKGILNNKISTIMFEELAREGIESHFIKSISDREMLVKKVEILPLEVIVRNITAGSFCKRYGVEEGIVLDQPIFEMSYKNDEFGDPLLNDDHAVALKLATREEIEFLRNQTLKINEIMKRFFLKMDLKLVDFKLEFGKDSDGKIILADEISPDTCRLWDVNTNEKLDKDRFRRDLGDLVEGYEEVLARLNK
nr:phosphoribosylaminoimidazolesuccinocarboxamide synthase [uncultured Terrisporobacter sp.]